MIYIASPYSTLIKGPAAQSIVAERYKKVLEFVTFIMLTKGPPAFSPIVYCHPIAMANPQLGTDAAYWHKFNMSFLRKAEALFVLMIPGWDVSKGIKLELEVAKVLDIPVEYYDHENFARVERQ